MIATILSEARSDTRGSFAPVDRAPRGLGGRFFHGHGPSLKIVSAGALASAIPAGIKRALALPANNRTGTIADIEHIVILMQENRSFDHYFGTMRGVRGFGDPHAVKLPSGDPVWYQPNGTGRVLPFHPDAPDLGLQFLEDRSSPPRQTAAPARPSRRRLCT